MLAALSKTTRAAGLELGTLYVSFYLKYLGSTLPREQASGLQLHGPSLSLIQRPELIATLQRRTSTMATWYKSAVEMARI